MVTSEEDLLPAAIEWVVANQVGSAQHLQRQFKISHDKANTLLDLMEERGLVGPFEGTRPRSVLMSRTQWQRISPGDDEEPEEDLDDYSVSELSSYVRQASENTEMDLLVEKTIEKFRGKTALSLSDLQRQLNLGYAQAEQVMDQLDERGLIGPYEGSKPRQILWNLD
jgi:DNA segregation ATPase FtsK/SpoIIIE-like protein